MPRAPVVILIAFLAMVAHANAETVTIAGSGDGVLSSDGTRIAFLADDGISLWDDTGALVKRFPVEKPAIERIVFDGTTVIGIAKDRIVRYDDKPRAIPLKPRVHDDNAWLAKAGHLYLTRHVEGETTLELLDVDLRGKRKPRSLLLPYEAPTPRGIAVTKDGKTLSLLTFDRTKEGVITHAHTIDVVSWKARGSTTIDVWWESISTLSDDGKTLYRGRMAIDLATNKQTELFPFPGNIDMTSATGATVVARFPKTSEYSLWTPASNQRVKLPAGTSIEAVSDTGSALFCGAKDCTLVKN